MCIKAPKDTTSAPFPFLAASDRKLDIGTQKKPPNPKLPSLAESVEFQVSTLIHSLSLSLSLSRNHVLPLPQVHR
jgi:hypothetical protein